MVINTHASIATINLDGSENNRSSALNLVDTDQIEEK